MRALSVIHNPVFGGAHNELLRQRPGLRERGWEVQAIVADGPSSGADRLREAGVDVTAIPLHRLRASADPRLHLGLAGAFPREVGALRRLIRDRRADLVQVHGVINVHAAVAAHLEGVAVCWHLYDMVAPLTLRRALAPAVVRLADSVTTIGRALARAHPGVERLGERLVVTSPPVDFERFAPDRGRRARAREELGLAEGVVAIALVGNLFPNKNQLLLLEAARRLVGAGTPAAPNKNQLLLLEAARRLVGAGTPAAVRLLGGRSPAHADYEAQVHAALAATPGAAWVDPGTRVDELLPGFDILAMPSLSEGMPTVVLEAMGCALPVVASDVGAVGELVVEGETGTLVPAGDAAALAAALEALVRDGTLRTCMGAAGRERVLAGFGLERVVGARVRAYDLALAHRRARAARS